MRILCTNDDGILAPGLDILEQIAMELAGESGEVVTVAPEQDQSGVGRALTLTKPLFIREVDNDRPQLHRYAVSGTPSDCIQMALLEILKDNPPDLVVSGVNNGQNIADDVTLSGTLGACFQAMQMGVPAVGMSLTRFRRDACHWETPLQHAPDILRKLLDTGWPENVVMNVNFPDRAPDEVGEIKLTRQGRRDVVNLYAEKREDLRERAYYWLGHHGNLSNPPEGTDLRAIYDGHISITPLHLSITDFDALEKLKSVY